MRVLAVADGDAGKAAALAARLGREVWDLRARLAPPFIPVEEAVNRIARHQGHRELSRAGSGTLGTG